MKKLMVSFDCGCRYEPFMESENIEELIKRTNPLTDPRKDISWTRWYIEEDGQRIDDIICPIHGEILTNMIALSRRIKNPSK